MSTTKLRDFITSVTAIVERGCDEPTMTQQVRPLLGRLVAKDDWLPAPFAQPDPQRYRQYLLHCDPSERFSVVSFVWGPGQRTPVHDHTVWGLIGILRGAEISIPYALSGKGLEAGAPQRLEAGAVAMVSPNIGDIHEVANAHADRTSISIHVYGGNIGAIRRHVYDSATGVKKTFISGYSADVVPNLWDRSGEA